MRRLRLAAYLRARWTGGAGGARDTWATGGGQRLVFILLHFSRYDRVPILYLALELIKGGSGNSQVTHLHLIFRNFHKHGRGNFPQCSGLTMQII